MHYLWQVYSSFTLILKAWAFGPNLGRGILVDSLPFAGHRHSHLFPRLVLLTMKGSRFLGSANLSGKNLVLLCAHLRFLVLFHFWSLWISFFLIFFLLPQRLICKAFRVHIFNSILALSVGRSSRVPNLLYCWVHRKIHSNKTSSQLETSFKHKLFPPYVQNQVLLIAPNCIQLLRSIQQSTPPPCIPVFSVLVTPLPASPSPPSESLLIPSLPSPKSYHPPCKGLVLGSLLFRLYSLSLAILATPVVSSTIHTPRMLTCTTPVWPSCALQVVPMKCHHLILHKQFQQNEVTPKGEYPSLCSDRIM